MLRPLFIAKIGAITFLVLAAALLGYSCLKPAEKQVVQTVRVAESVRSPYFLPQYLALHLGYFLEQNLEVTITTTSPEAIRNALADQRTDIALCGLHKIIFNPGMSGKEKPRPLIFAAIARRDGSFLLARENVADFQWSNLHYKTIIGRSHNDSSEIALEQVLRQAGIPPYRRVTIYNNIPESLRLGAFRAGTGHYLQLLEPEATLAEINGYGKVIASVGEAGGDLTVTAYAALPGYIESHPEVIQGFTNALYKAQLWLQQHSAAEAAAVVRPSFTGIETQVLAQSIERYSASGIWADSPVVAREPFDKFNIAAKNAGEIIAPVPYETTVVTGFARQAVETVVYPPESEQKKKESLFLRYLPQLRQR